MKTKKQLSVIIKSKAANAGFLQTGIAKAIHLEEEEKQLKEWLNRGYHGEMSYMENHFSVRVDPDHLVKDAKSVICLSYNYFPKKNHTSGKNLKIARYAYGRDYHKVIKKKLYSLLNELKEITPQINARVFVDSAPIMERTWAARAGIGWQGKNTLLLHPRHGSYFFLAEIVTDIELEYDAPIRDHCGTCTRCIDACPTDAIHPEGYLLDASRCISYETIEYRGENMQLESNGWIFGCDICQEVCPWNKFATPHNDEDLDVGTSWPELHERDWLELDQESYRELFRHSAIKRTKFTGLKRNVDHALMSMKKV